MISVPNLHRQSCWDLQKQGIIFTFKLIFADYFNNYFAGGLIPREHGLLFGDDHLLLRGQVLEGIDEPPVEVALSSQRPIT